MKTLYVHMGWGMPYPFSPRTWSPQEWDQWVAILSKNGLERLMVWPGLEFIALNRYEELREVRERILSILEACHQHHLEVWFGRSPNGYIEQPKRAFELRDATDLNYLHPKDPNFELFIIHPIREIFKDLKPDGWWVIDRDPGDSFDTSAENFAEILSSQTKASGAPTAIHWMWAGWTTQSDQADGWREKSQSFWVEVAQACERSLEMPLVHLACWPGHVESLKNAKYPYLHFPYHHLEGEPSLPWSFHSNELDHSSPDLGWSFHDPWVMNIQTPCLRTPHLINILNGVPYHSTTWDEIEEQWVWSQDSLEKIKQPWRALNEEFHHSQPDTTPLNKWLELLTPHPPIRRGALIDKFPQL